MGNLLKLFPPLLTLTFTGNLFAVNLYAEEIPLSGSVSAGITNGTYTGVTFKDSLYGYGADLSLNYLDNISARGGLNYTGIYYDVPGRDPSTFELSQSEVKFEFNYSFFSDLLRGKLTPGLQSIRYAGNLSDPYLGDVTTAGPVLRYINNARSFYIDAHYSISSYEKSYSITQFDAAIAGSLFSKYNWVKLRAYQINTAEVTDIFREQGYLFASNYAVAELSYKHWLNFKWGLLPASVEVSTSFGNSLLGVNPDTLAISNLLDEKLSETGITLDWNASHRFNVLVFVGISEYQKYYHHQGIRRLDNYTNTNGYLQISKNW